MEKLQVAGDKSQVASGKSQTKKIAQSYRDMEIYQMGHSLALGIHQISLKLPRYELYETGSQIRKSSKSISVNIVEGFGRRRYTAEYIRFLIYAHASCDETMEHLRFLHEAENLSSPEFQNYLSRYELLSKKLCMFINSIERGFKR